MIKSFLRVVAILGCIALIVFSIHVGIQTKGTEQPAWGAILLFATGLLIVLLGLGTTRGYWLTVVFACICFAIAIFCMAVYFHPDILRVIKEW